MPQYDITSPQGEKFRVTAPEGVTQDQALSYFKQNYKPPTTPTSSINSGPLATSEAIQRGAVASFAGIPGDIESAVRTPFKLAGEYLGLPKQYSEAMGKTYLPTTSQLEESLPGKDVAKAHPTAQTVGEFLPAAVPLGAGVAKVGEPIVKEVADVVPRIVYGATKRAEKAVGTIAAPTDSSVLGEKMSKFLRSHLDKLWQSRSAATAKLREQAFSHNEAADTVRGKMLGWLRYVKTSEAKNLNDAQRGLISSLEKKLARNKSIEGLDLERRDLVEFAEGQGEEGATASTRAFAGRLADIFRDQLEKNVPGYKEYLSRYRQMSDPINTFTDTALGKRVALDVSKRLDIPKYEPATLPKSFFKSKASMRALLKASGGNQAFVDEAAADHAANALAEITRNRPISEAATAARNWLEHHREWLDQAPRTEKAVEQYVANLEKTKTVQRMARLGAGGALLLYLAHPVWGLRSAIMALGR